MSEDFDPSKTSRMKVPTPWGAFEFTSKRMAEVIAFVASLGAVGTLFLQWHTIKAIDANTTAIQAGTAENRFRLEKLDASNRYAVCMARERDAKDMRDAERNCRQDSGIGMQR